MPYLIEPVVRRPSMVDGDQPAIRVPDQALLRPWVSSDADDLLRAFQDPAIQRWHVRRLDTLHEAHTLLDDWATSWSAKDWHWALVDDDTGALLGRAALKGIDVFDGNAGVAYWILPEARGRGLCSAAVSAVSDWAFHTAGFHRLSIEHSVANPASCRVAQNAHFAIEGVQRGAARHADGWHDMCLHSRLATDHEVAVAM